MYNPTNLPVPTRHKCTDLCVQDLELKVKVKKEYSWQKLKKQITQL